MRIKLKAAGLVAAAGALAIAVPAAAHPGNTHHPSNTNSHQKSCKVHKVAYIVSGVIKTTTMVQDPGATTWSGILTYTPKNHNHAARNDTGSATLTNVKVKFDDGTTAFAPGEQVQLIGKIEAVRSHGHFKCSNAPSTTPTFRMVVVHPAPTS